MAVFYRKYRPQKLSDIFGQEQVTATLMAQLTSGKISHGYLFSGPKGSGKTSTARIIAKAINCERYRTKDGKRKNLKFGEPCNRCVSCLSITAGSNLDLVEIDAASNRGIDEIRELREKVRLAPVSSNYKVYIIDEAHMLTTEAFNAFLKTLEEPPSHVVFILCTTSAAKLPATIISRLSRFNFLRARNEDLIKAIAKVCNLEGIKIAPDAAKIIADASDGSWRDALSLLEQAASGKKKINSDDVRSVTAFSTWNFLYDFVGRIFVKDLKRVVSSTEEMFEAGEDISTFVRELILFLEKVLFLKIGIPSGSIDLGQEQITKISQLSEKVNFGELSALIKDLLVAEAEIKKYPLPQIPLVLALCNFCRDEIGRGSELRVEVEENLPAVQEATVLPKSSSGRAKKSTKSFEKIVEKWPQFLEKVKPVNAHLFAILKSTKPVELEGMTLTVDVFFRFHKEKLEEVKIANLLSAILGETMGIPVILKFELAERTIKPPKTVSQSDVSEIEGDELSKIAQEIFSE